MSRGLVAAPADGIATLRIWQANLGQTILAHLPVQNEQPVEEGDDTRREPGLTGGLLRRKARTRVDRSPAIRPLS